MLAKISARSGLHVFGYRGYQSIIRGGHVWYQIDISEEKLLSHQEGIDILVALNQDAINNQKSHLRENAVVVYDPTKTNTEILQGRNLRFVKLPMLDIAMKESGNPIMRNVAAIGAVLGLVGIDISIFESAITRMFTKKGEKVVSENIKVGSEGYKNSEVKQMFVIKGDKIHRHVIEGNAALALGAYASGCKLYSAYPMTPASTILHWFAEHEGNGVTYKQVEDEIAAINVTIGAASAGIRAMCGTSGGGFSLMVEGLGLAGMIEAPIVVVLSQRTGPSTGLPTKTEQGDVLFAMHASQGEFPRIVVAPRNIEECFKLSSDAFNLADRYQCPVIILMDLYMSEHSETTDAFNFDSIKIDRGKIAWQANPAERFKRYLYTDDGVSPRSIPGTPGLEFIAGSDEHDEYGDLVSDAFSGIDEYVETRRKMMRKRMNKIETMLKNEDVFHPAITNESAKNFLVTFGSTTGAALEAAQILNSQGMDFGVISFNYLMPLDADKTKKLLEGKSLIDVEVNFTAQLAQIIKSNTGIDIQNRILKYDGEAITAEQIAKEAQKIIQNK